MTQRVDRLLVTLGTPPNPTSLPHRSVPIHPRVPPPHCRVHRTLRCVSHAQCHGLSRPRPDQKAPELSQLFPTLCHDAYVVRRWLGSVGCAVYWTTVTEDINRMTNTPNISHPLTGLIACSLTKLRDPQRGTSSPKVRTLRETLRSHLKS